MKVSAAVSLAVAVSSITLLGQGVLNFSNLGNGVDAPVSDWDGTRLFGSAFAADLYFGLGKVTDSTVIGALGQPAVFDTNGYFFGGIRTIPNAPAGATITCQVRVWAVADPWVWSGPWFPPYPPSARIGQSSLFQVVLTGSTNTASSLTGLIPFQTVPLGVSPPVSVTVNESTTALVFSWPEYGRHFALQEGSDLTSTNWLTLTNTPLLTGSQTPFINQLSISKPARTTFYRLVAQ